MSYYEIPSDFSGKKFGSGSPDDDHPRLKPDLVVRQQTHRNEVHFILKDPSNQAYYKFSPSEWEIISLFDGTRTVDQMVDEYNRRHPNDIIDDESIASYKQDLRDMEILDIPSIEKNLMLMEKIREQRKERAAGPSKWSNLMEVTFSAWDPDEWMTRVIPRFRFLWTKEFFVISIIMVALMLFVNFLKWDEFTEGTIRLYTFTDKSLWEILVFLILMTTTGTIHEFGHAMTLKHYGGEVHQMGFLLFYLSPAFYVDVSDSYILPRKERLWVTMAGTYTELILCSIATFFWYFATPGTLIYDLAFQVILFTGISSFFINMNPLIKLDGYYAVMDLVEIPDLREESFAYLSRLIKKNIFRMKVEEPEDMTRRKRRIFLTYGVLAILYTTLVYVLIVFWLRNIFLESFHEYAYLLLLLVIYLLFRTELRSAGGFLKFAYLDKKEVMLMKAKNLKVILPAIAILLFVLFVPRTHIKISSPFVIEPVRRAEVRAEVEGFIQQVLKDENDPVNPGDVLGVLVNPELSNRAEKNKAEQELLTRELASLQSTLYVSEYQIKLRERQQLSEAGRDFAFKLGKLSLRSPIKGKIVTPYLQEKIGSYLSKGAVFCTVADASKVKVEIPVREYYVHDVKKGQTVELKLDAYPAETFEGQVVEISSAITERIEALEGTYTVFRVTANVENSDGRLVRGMQGDAKILAEKYSIGGRIGREFWRWIKSKIW
jgi:putative peptide zinc metalloprotease protein